MKGNRVTVAVPNKERQSARSFAILMVGALITGLIWPGRFWPAQTRTRL
jgi:hypothetical protein